MINKMKTKNIIPVAELPLPPETISRISRSFSTYAAMGIVLEIVNVENGVVTVVATQNQLLNGFILNNHQLYDRAKDVFAGIDDLKFNILPSVFSLQLDNIDLEYIKTKMDEFGIKRNDLIKQLGFDKSYISRLFSEDGKFKIELSKNAKATFFYYFLTYELNRDLRNQLT